LLLIGPSSSPRMVEELKGSGVSFNFRYVGNIEVEVSMRSLDYPGRVAIVSECIYLVCAKASLLPSRMPNPALVQQIGVRSQATTFVDLNVDFVVSTRGITVVHCDSNLLFSHALPSVSFALSGCQDLDRFLCYVAKDDARGRRCYVYECGSSTAERVLSCIEQAFQLKTAANATAISKPPINTSPAPRTKPTLSTELPAPPLALTTAKTPEYVNEMATGGNLAALNGELWFHGRLSREVAEGRLRKDGDFLVRETSNETNNIVLSGMQNGSAKHLLLIDSNGRVRTRDRQFENVAHLIQYHRDNRIPITSEGSALLLLTPIWR